MDDGAAYQVRGARELGELRDGLTRVTEVARALRDHGEPPPLAEERDEILHEARRERPRLRVVRIGVEAQDGDGGPLDEGGPGARLAFTFELREQRRGLFAVRRAQGMEEVLDVALDRRLRDREEPGDFAVREPLREQREHLVLPRRERALLPHAGSLPPSL